MNQDNFKDNNGFTLIETIIYVAIIGIAISSFLTFGISISTSRSKVYTIQEVQANARMLMDTITQTIMHAQAVISPLAGQNSDLIVLDMPDSESNITFSLSDGIVFLTEGVGDPLALISDKVEVTNIQFTNTSSFGEVDSILVEFDIQYKNAASIEFSFSDSFRSAVTLRY